MNKQEKQTDVRVQAKINPNLNPQEIKAKVLPFDDGSKKKKVK